MPIWRAWLGRLSVVALLASLLGIVGVPSVQADDIPATAWSPTSLSTLKGASTLVTDPTGGVTVGCPQDAYRQLLNSAM